MNDRVFSFQRTAKTHMNIDLGSKAGNATLDQCLVMTLFLQSYCDDPDLVLELKNLIVIFADTLQVG